MVRVLGSGSPTPTQFFWYFPHDISMSPTNRRYRHLSFFYRTQKRSQVSKFLQNFCLLLTPTFLPIGMIAIASSNFRFLASLIDVFSFVLRCFRFFELVHGVFRGPCLLKTYENYATTWTLLINRLPNSWYPHR